MAPHKSKIDMEQLREATRKVFAFKPQPKSIPKETKNTNAEHLPEDEDPSLKESSDTQKPRPKH